MRRPEAEKAGTTTRQMQEAPRHGVFVWPVARSLSYATDLAAFLGRADLVVLAASQLRSRWIDNVPAVVIDHGCSLTAEEWHHVARLEAPAHRLRQFQEKQAQERIAREGTTLEDEGRATRA